MAKNSSREVPVAKMQGPVYLSSFTASLLSPCLWTSKAEVAMKDKQALVLAGLNFLLASTPAVMQCRELEQPS